MVRSVITTVLILLVLLVVVRSIRIVKQARMGIIMRLGKFHTEAKTGIHLLVPFIDTMSYMIDLREMVVDFPPQPVITKDNVTMQIDTVVYYKITDPKAAMEKQMRAERERREAILQAEGEKQSKILIAEGEKQSAILRAEAKKESMIREAEGERESKILEAQGEAEAIRNKKLAEADGIRSVFTAMKEANVDDNILALKSMEAIEKLGESPSSKLVLPSDAVNFLGTFKGIKEVMSDKESK